MARVQPITAAIIVLLAFMLSLANMIAFTATATTKYWDMMDHQLGTLKAQDKKPFRI